jgi:ABC-2 type transport system ATP-binding protein
VPAVEVAGLRKAYGGVEALRGLDLQVPAGSISGFLGRNGAGKTTTLKILLGLTRPTSGTARVFGLAADSPPTSLEIRRRTGFVSEEKDLFGSMTVREIVRFTAAFFPRWREDLEQRYLRMFDLPLGPRVRTLSRGARSRLALLLALCRGAELLVLDEPTSGLDPASAEEVLQALVTQAATDGVTILFSTHQIAEVEQIADHVAIVDRGRTVVAGDLDDVRATFCRVRMVFDGAAPPARFHAPGALEVRREGRVLSVLSRGGAEPLVAEARALGPSSLEVLPMTLKEIFLEGVGGEE